MSLNLGNIYDLVDTYQLAEGEYFYCQHCGKPIRNICEIKTEDNNIYQVGSQCVKKLLALDGSDYWKNQEIEKNINKYFTGLRSINKALLINSNGYFIGLLLNNPKYDPNARYGSDKYKTVILEQKAFKTEDFANKPNYIGNEGFDSLHGLTSGLLSYARENL